MGTNYYLKSDEPFDGLGFDTTTIHLGKSSSGWHFSLHVYPKQGISNWNNWMVLLLVAIEGDGAFIENEYGEKISFASFYDTVVNRKGRGTEDCTEAFLKSNYTERGYAGLLRHALLKGYCIGHSEGTYDYLIGESF